MGEFAPLLRAFARMGLPASELWAMELWEIAAALGVGEPDADTPPSASRTPSGRDLIAERVRAHRAGLPPPRPDAPPPRPPSTVTP